MIGERPMALLNGLDNYRFAGVFKAANQSNTLDITSELNELRQTINSAFTNLSEFVSQA